MKIVRLLLVCFVVTFSLNTSAQDSSSYQIQLLARAQKSYISLRWAPSSPETWKLANEHGMKLKRYTILRNGKMLTKPEVKNYATLFKPLPLKEWEKITEHNDLAFVAAQAFYGESFEVSEDFSSGITKAINQTKELEQRHFFALYAADHSKEVALASGLMFEDKSVRKNEKYLYTISCSVPDASVQIDSSSVYIGLEDYFPLPTPEGLQATVIKGNVLLSWNGRRFKDFFVSYIVERSDDYGSTFKSITDKPIVTPLDENGEVAEYVFKSDSIVDYKKRYLYRVRGISPFAESSIPSKVIKVTVKPDLDATPRISKVSLTAAGAMEIQWEFTERTKLKGFILTRADNINGEYKVLKEDIGVNDSVALDINPLPNNYYRVTAVDKFGNKTTSSASLGVLEDSIPPKLPMGLVGEIDSEGVVALRWDKNTENDLVGYQIFMANFRNEEFVQVTHKIATDTNYFDTITNHTLTREIYYKIAALDHHYNVSAFSAVLELVRPDIIPPSLARFTSFSSNESGIHLEWNNSASKDVVFHTLYRKAKEDSVWKNIHVSHQIEEGDSYLDEVVIGGVQYTYGIIATDSAGNESSLSKTVTLKSKVKSLIIPQIEKFKVIRSDEVSSAAVLTWKYNSLDVSKFLIYRAENEKSLKLLKEVKSNELEFIDDNILRNTKYKYRVQAILKNGELSPFSREAFIAF